MFSAVTLAELKQPEQMYRKLGAKLVVGMPFKDIATSDSILMREVGLGFSQQGSSGIRVY